MSISAIRSRIGTPQLVALLLLLAYVLQCVWFSAHQPLTALEGVYIEGGLLHLEGYGHADSRQYTALVPLLAGVAARLSGAERHVSQFNDYRVVLRLPFLLAGLLLGASLWYVARRLYGNIGGYVALGLYCFSPAAVGSASQIGPAIVGAWGGFGLIFTSIAVAHTLYAPREVVLWNWRRILLLGLSIAICVGAQFSFWILLLPALLFMLWVGHVRPWAALTIFAAACATGLVLLSGLYGFRPIVFAKALAHAEWLEVASPNFFQPGMSSLLRDFFLQNGLGLVVLMAVSLVTFIVWKRARFFGTAAPLLVGVLVFTFALRMHFSAFTFLFLALPFLLLFMAGISADLLESRYALAANAVIFGVLIANSMIDVYGLLNLTSRSR
ncbi:MAG: hypothetical protein WCC87_21260 [Candidatus Korobacteraceae bacterium]